MTSKSAIKRFSLLAAVGIMSVACTFTALAKTRLATVEDLYWDEENSRTKAVWEEIEDADHYEVRLYRDESSIATFTPKKCTIDMKSRMKQEGDYYFMVRAVAKSNSKDFTTGNWSEESDSVYITSSYAEFLEGGGVIDTQNSGPGVQGSGGQTGSASIPATSVVGKSEWIQDAKGWWYRNADGTYPANGWWQNSPDSPWYYFDAEGYMATGWIDSKEKKYYCMPGDGYMVTGDVTIENVLYHFDSTGALIQ